MPSSSRIIAAEDLADAQPFTMGALPSDYRRSQIGSNPTQGPQQYFEAGYRKGLAEGNTRANNARELETRALGLDLAHRVDALLLGFEREYAAFEQSASTRLIDLAIALAGQIVRKEVEVDREAILPVIEETIGLLTTRNEPAVLRLNPADAQLARIRLEKVLLARGIEIAEDPAIGAGGCKLESAQVDVDATLATRWQRVMAAIGRDVAPPAGLDE